MGLFSKIKDKLIGTKQDIEQVSQKFKDGLAKTRDSFVGKMEDLLYRSKGIDEDFYEELEEILISSDIGVATVMDIIDEVRTEVKENRIKDAKELQPIIIEKMKEILGKQEDIAINFQENDLTVIVIVGVNGVGKTTTIGKLAHKFKQQDLKVVLAAGDTFRAAAIDQLKVWSQRTGVDVIAQQEGSDPAAVMYDAIHAAKARKADVLICDTAGRLHNKTNLMNELNKVYRVIGKEIPGAPHEVLLVLDATTGQNAMQQAKTFGESAGVTGIVLTKLDGTAKGGIVIAIGKELKIPVKLVGLGEKAEDLQEFNQDTFIEALFSSDLFTEEVPVENNEEGK
ncbi:signal recognition particle-docking protein FtsY [Desulfuribacillus alkaliarsenatis]|uniref:Signal recognition particle receptor FtsY n=1 Tax=Desulfuribacillus alkaliarsenatis TaxID=766136 RepID=A0A1E5G5W5_9FIRM|nr:signal recognition particle-docking protein FtsY [Desulfuribacillus alkaliarsenatis]OEF98566.1 signal recognition particle-docking protein FtsY [Desulfuribacillus alkaliarsenatis]